MESMTIRDEGGRLIPMRFSESQELLWQHAAPRLAINDKLWFIVLKGRQVYSTTFFENLVFTRTIEKPNTNSLIIAHDLDSSTDIFGMAKRFHDHLPLPKLRPSKAKVIDFPFAEGPSRFQVVSAGKMAKGRGTTQSCVHASEVAFWPHPEVLLGLFQAMPDLPDTIWILESTANGMTGIGQPFYDEWVAAVEGRSQLVPIFIPWFTMRKYRADPPVNLEELDDEENILLDQFGDRGVDGHSLRWRRFAIETKCQGSVDLFHQEYPSTPEEAFISSGLPAFDAQAILRQQKNLRAPSSTGTLESGRFVSQHKGWLRVWQTPQDGHAYVIGADCAEARAAGIPGFEARQGLGDYACAQVIDMTTLEQVALLHGMIPPWDFASQLHQLGRWYGTAVVAVEVTGPGHAVQDYLMRVFSYPNLHMWRGKADSYTRPIGKLYGWETNVYSRPLLIEAGRRAINTGLAIIRDAGTLGELSRFSRSDSGKYEAEVGHDDRVLALLIALRSREENYSGAAPRTALASDYSLADVKFPRGLRVVTSAPAGELTRRNALAGRKQRLSTAVRQAKGWMEY